MQLFSICASIAAVLLFSSSAAASDRTQRPDQISIRVKSGEWGTARVQDIEAVLKSVVGVLLPYFPQRASERVVVSFSRQGPRVLLDRLPDRSHQVLLNVQDTRWDQFAYQSSGPTAIGHPGDEPVPETGAVWAWC